MTLGAILAVLVGGDQLEAVPVMVGEGELGAGQQALVRALERAAARG